MNHAHDALLAARNAANAEADEARSLLEAAENLVDQRKKTLAIAVEKHKQTQAALDKLGYKEPESEPNLAKTDGPSTTDQ